MKWLAESLPFHLFTNPSMINWFIFGHWVVIYYLNCIQEACPVTEYTDKASVVYHGDKSAQKMYILCKSTFFVDNDI